MMKQDALVPVQPGEETHAFCPVECPVCRYENNVYPARFHTRDLVEGADLSGMERKANHILFLLEGRLHIRTQTDNHYHLDSGQCMFFPRTSMPDIRALAPTRIVWLDFSNRLVLGGQDALASAAAKGCKSPEKTPVLPIVPLMESMLINIQKEMRIPCYHMLKQYELFFLMKSFYSDEELACFFNAILRPSHDFRAFVESNYTNADTLEDIARKANLSTSYFIKRFKEVFGVSVHRWLVKQKEEQLKRMLMAERYDAGEMARQLGLKSKKGLYQFCRQRFGCSMTRLKETLKVEGSMGRDKAAKDNYYRQKDNFNTRGGLDS